MSAIDEGCETGRSLETVAILHESMTSNLSTLGRKDATSDQLAQNNLNPPNLKSQHACQPFEEIVDETEQ